MNRQQKQYIIVNVDNGETLKVLGAYHLSKDFQVYEFVSTDKSEVVLYSADHIKKLQGVRDYYDKPVIVNSGHREIEFNASEVVDGDEDSEHLYGLATDFYIKGVPIIDLYSTTSEFFGYFSNIGKYTTHIHVGTKGYHRRA